MNKNLGPGLKHRLMVETIVGDRTIKLSNLIDLIRDCKSS